jgi:pyrroloquinoline-quinone synthase
LTVLNDTFRGVVAQVHCDAAIPARPFFAALADASMQRAVFVHTQQQFEHAVEHFARPMMALGARLERAEGRMVLASNVWDEHGRGSLSGCHGGTFRELLLRLGCGEGAIPAGAPVRAFNAALMGVCTYEPVPLALATLAIIEHLFVGISGRIGAGVVSMGWLSDDELVHYAVHEALDIAHADALYAPIEAMWQAGHARADIRVGLKLGAHVFLRLYDDLYADAVRACAP